ncbi:hypothetical protein MMC25_008204 [Agyrium rufum]|nr:hypothetical protein [Agyrium rufum]
MSFFIVFASVAGIIGRPGQVNNAAGNTYQDALAQHRVSNGEKAVSLDKGLMDSEGILAENERLMNVLDSTGAYMRMSVAEMHALLEMYCHPNAPISYPDKTQIICGIEHPHTTERGGRQEPIWMPRPLFRHLHFADNSKAISSESSSSGANSPNFKSIFGSSESMSYAGAAVADALAEKLSRSLSMPSTDVDHSKPLQYYGVDSLIAVELRNWFAKELLNDVPVFEILGNKTCTSTGLLAVEKNSFRRPEWTAHTRGNGDTAELQTQ